MLTKLGFLICKMGVIIYLIELSSELKREHVGRCSEESWACLGSSIYFADRHMVGAVCAVGLGRERVGAMALG